MELSKEKLQIMQMSDEEVRRLLALAKEKKQLSPPPRPANRKSADLDGALQGIIGLDEPKRALRRIIAYHRLQEEAKARGIVLNDKTCHMCFVGNPGTAKTTFARACAKAFQIEGMLAGDAFIEVGRADLIASYSGQTAPKVKKAIKSAAGGVLFIDEAYSLLEDAEGGYGDEAIATLVQEMENRRDVIVIFAGYPDKMEAFLSRNPGLKSRVPFTVHFPDYSCEELVEIAGCIARKGGFRLDPGSEAVIRDIVRQEMGRPDFGNARYVRNLIEAAQMNRACSLAYKADLRRLPDSELFVLRAEDFEKPQNIGDGGMKGRTIGFSAT